jgi:GT2 family glycosyltransferase
MTALPAHELVAVSAVIVNWNTRELLDQCLRSLRAHGGRAIEVVVVDNGSTDGSVGLLQEQWPDVRVIANPENRGYQAANNQGMHAASGDVLLLINSDAKLQPGCLDTLLDRLARDTRAAIVGPRLVYGDGRFQRWTAGRLPSLASTAASMFGVDRLRPTAGVWIGRDVHRAFTPGWVSSACLVLRRSALADVGFMDERYFAYMDDVDLCARAWDAGYRVWYEPSATATHLMGQSTKRRTGTSSPLAVQSFIRWFEQRNGRTRGSLLRTIVAAGFLARAVAHGAKGVVRPDERAPARTHLRSARLALRRDASNGGMR